MNRDHIEWGRGRDRIDGANNTVIAPWLVVTVDCASSLACVGRLNATGADVVQAVGATPCNTQFYRAASSCDQAGRAHDRAGQEAHNDKTVGFHCCL